MEPRPNMNRARASRTPLRTHTQSTGGSGRFHRNLRSRAHGVAPMPHAVSTSQLEAVGHDAQPPLQHPEQRSHAGRISAVRSVSTLQGLVCGEEEDALSDDSDAASVLSEFDLVNDTIQEYLLASDNSDSEANFSGDFGEDTTAMATLYVSALLPIVSANMDGAARRRRMAKKSTNSAALTAAHARRLQTSHSTGSLQALDTEGEGPGRGEKRPRRARKRVVQVRRHQSERGEAVANATPDQQRAALLRPLKPRHRGVPVGPLSIVLDIDETLVAARDGPIHVRPHVKTFLDACEELRCEIIVWTAGVASYVNPILHAIADACGRKAWFHHIISRHWRWYSTNVAREASGVKDLHLLGRPLERVLLIENNPVSVCRQPLHAVLVEDYLQPNSRDDTLHHLTGVVKRAVTRMSGVETSNAASSMHNPSVHPLTVPAAAAEPMLRPRLPVTAALDREEALTYADFDVGSNSDGHEHDAEEEEEGKHAHSRGRRWQRSPQTAAEEAGDCCYGPQLPAMAANVPQGCATWPSVGNEEEELDERNRANAPEERGSRVIPFGPAYAPPPALLVGKEVKTEVAMAVGRKTARCVRCRVMSYSALSPSVCTRSYGCLSPMSD